MILVVGVPAVSDDTCEPVQAASRAFDKVRPALWRQSCELVAWVPRAKSLPATLIRQAAVTKCWLVHEAAGAAGPTDCSACTTQGAIPASRPPGDRDWLISAKRHGQLAGLGWNQRSQSRALGTAAKLRCGTQVRTFRPISSRDEQNRNDFLLWPFVAAWVSE